MNFIGKQHKKFGTGNLHYNHTFWLPKILKEF